MAKAHQKKNSIISDSMCSNQVIQDPPLSWLHWYIPPFLLSLISLIVYYPSLHYNFQFDDIANISKFYSIRHQTFEAMFFSGTRWISYWLNSINYSIAKFDPFIYRMANVTFHSISGITIFLFLLTALTHIKKQSFFTQYKFPISYLTAALFLLHPVQTQTVSYVIQGQLEGLAFLCMILVCFCFLRAHTTRYSVLYILFMILTFALALISCGTKEITIVSPFFIMLTDWFFIAQGDWRAFKKRIPLHILFFITIWGTYIYLLKPAFFKELFGLSMVAYNNIGNVLTENPDDAIKPVHFFISQFKVILHYLVMFIWPFSISVEYDWKLVHHFFSPDCILPLLLLITLATIVIHMIKKDTTSLVAFAALWFVIAIAPRSSFIPSSELLADYKTYSASFGVLLLLAFAMVRILTLLYLYVPSSNSRISNTIVYYCCIALVITYLGYLTYNRNKVWSSSERFWANIVENAPGKARAYNNLGVALSEYGKIQESIPLYKKAILMDRFYPDPWNNLAVAYSLTNKLDLAISTLKQAIRIHRDYPEGYNNLASFLITKKDYALAEQMLQCAISLRPYYGKAHFNYGKLYLDQGNLMKAFESFKAACTQADFDNEMGFSVYATTSIHTEHYEDAIFAFSKLLELQPHSINYSLNLANAYFLNDQIFDAITTLHNTINKDPQEMQAWFNLAECYLKTSQPEKALECFLMVKKNKPNSIPVLDLRIAACLDFMGNSGQACMVLQDLATQTTNPDIKATALLALDEIKKEQSFLAAIT